MKKIISILLTILCLFSSFTTSLAFGSSSDVHPDSDVNSVIIGDFSMDTDTINGSSRSLYTYAWRVKSTSVHSSNNVGSWRTGPTGLGPGTLNINNSTSLNKSFTTSISGSYDIGTAKIGAALGVSIGKTNTYGTSYSLTLPNNQRRTIIYRPKYTRYKVVSEYVRMSNVAGVSSSVLKTQTAYVDAFVNWDYSWRAGY